MDGILSEKKREREREKERKKEKRKEGKIPPGSRIQYNTYIVMNRMFINTSLSIGGEVLAFAVQ